MNDKMLNELIAVVAMANEINRLVSSYQVELDGNLKQILVPDKFCIKNYIWTK